MSASGRDGLLDVRVRTEAPRMSGSGWEALSVVLEWSLDPSGCPGEVGGPLDVWEWSGGPPG